MDNIIDSGVRGVATSHILDTPHALSLVVQTYALLDPLATTMTEYGNRYGESSVGIIQVLLQSLANRRSTPSEEIELTLLHAMMVAPVVVTFAPECLSNHAQIIDELDQLSDYLYSQFRYDRSAEMPTSRDDLNFMRGAVIEYYVGTSTDAPREHLEWLGERMVQISVVSETLFQRASIDRDLIESLVLSEPYALVDGML